MYLVKKILQVKFKNSRRMAINPAPLSARIIGAGAILFMAFGLTWGVTFALQTLLRYATSETPLSLWLMLISVVLLTYSLPRDLDSYPLGATGLLFGRDTPLLLTSPVPAKTIFQERFVFMGFRSLPMVLFFFIPTWTAICLSYKWQIGAVLFATVNISLLYLALSGIALLLNLLTMANKLRNIVGRVFPIVINIAGIFFVPLIIFSESESVQPVVKYAITTVSSLNLSVLPTTWIAFGVRLGAQGKLIQALFWTILVAAFAVSVSTVSFRLTKQLYYSGGFLSVDATGGVKRSRRHIGLRIAGVIPSVIRKDLTLMRRAGSSTIPLSSLIILFIGNLLIPQQSGELPGEVILILKTTIFGSIIIFLVVKQIMANLVERERDALRLIRATPIKETHFVLAKYFSAYAISMLVVLVFVLVESIVSKSPVFESSVIFLLMTIISGGICAVSLYSDSSSMVRTHKSTGISANVFGFLYVLPVGLIAGIASILAKTAPVSPWLVWTIALTLLTIATVVITWACITAAADRIKHAELY
jgi:hypothetical protein